MMISLMTPISNLIGRVSLYHPFQPVSKKKGFWTWYTPESDTYNQWNIPIVRTKSIPAGMRIIRWKFPAGKNELL